MNIQVFKGDLSAERLAQHLGAADAYGDNPGGGELAVDCEMMGLKPARDRLCLVQMCDGNGNVSLVQIAQEQSEAPNLQTLLEHSAVTKIFHFARADVAFLRFQLGILVRPLFCTKVASKLARTYTERHGLREVARELLGVDLNKNQQSSDWGRDELSSEQKEYAANDVIYLIQIKNKLETMLLREGRAELARDCFDFIHLNAQLDILGYDFVFEHNSPSK